MEGAMETVQWKEVQRTFKNKTCTKCDQVFNQVRDLERHTRNRKDLLCHHCNRTFCNEHHLGKHMRSLSEPKILTRNYQSPIHAKTRFEDDPQYHELLEEKKDHVNSLEKRYTNHIIINQKVGSNFTYNDLELLLVDIYSKQTNSFKINLGIVFVLYNIKTKEYKYHYVSSNQLLFEKAISITNMLDVERFMKKVCDLDLATNAYLRKPTSSWTLAGITNIEVWVYEMKNTPIGRPPMDLPTYIKDSKSIIALVHDGNKPITDNLCLFHCLTLHEGGKRKGLEKRAKMLKIQLKNQTGLCFDKGVCISHLPDVERIFEVSINVHSLQEDGNAEVIYLSRLNPVMHLNLWENHFSYVKNFKTYAKRFSCLLCDTTFDRVNNLNRHAKTCSNEQQNIYVGGKYKKDLSLFQRLKNAGYVVSEKDRFYPLISSFDMEAFQVKRNEKLQGRDILYKHIPASFLVHINIPGHTAPQHRQSSGNPQKFIDELVSILLLQQESASRLMHDKFSEVFTRLAKDIEDSKNKVESLPGKAKIREQMNLRKLETLQASLEKYCSQHVVLSFNGARYDLPLIKRYLPSSLKLFEEQLNQIINKDRSYMVMAMKRLKFLDVANYLAAGTSLANFYKAYKVKEQKSIFPYAWLDSAEKLNATYLPSRDKFYSVLTNSNVTEEEYEQAIETWALNGWEKFGQFVEYYNNLDVTGMTEAVEKMITEVYRGWGVDLFKDAFSLAGIAQRYVFRNLPEDVYFSNFGQEHEHIYRELREIGVTGGPSIVFTRYHEEGVTKIRGGNEICKKVIGLDCSSMYLECTAREMGTGWYTLREKKDGYRPQSRFSKEAIQWLEHTSKEKGIHICHEYNSPLGEQRIGEYKVDGFCEETRTVYEFNGCYSHGHCGENYSEAKWTKTVERENALREMDYNVESITACQWHEDPRAKIWYAANDADCSMNDIIKGVDSGELFGFVKLSLHVPEHLISMYREFPPVFKNTAIELEDIGSTMQKFCLDTDRRTDR